MVFLAGAEHWFDALCRRRTSGGRVLPGSAHRTENRIDERDIDDSFASGTRPPKHERADVGLLD